MGGGGLMIGRSDRRRRRRTETCYRRRLRCPTEGGGGVVCSARSVVRRLVRKSRKMNVDKNKKYRNVNVTKTPTIAARRAGNVVATTRGDRHPRRAFPRVYGGRRVSLSPRAKPSCARDAVQKKKTRYSRKNGDVFLSASVPPDVRSPSAAETRSIVSGRRSQCRNPESRPESDGRRRRRHRLGCAVRKSYSFAATRLVAAAAAAADPPPRPQPAQHPARTTADAVVMAALLLGHVVETDLETGARLCREAERAVLRLVAEDGREWLHVKRPRGLGAYDLADLDGVHTADGRAAFRFVRPHSRRQVVVQADGAAGLAAFLRAVRAAARRLDARLDDGYRPPIADTVSAGRYDQLPGTDLGSHLNALVLVNVDATALGDQIGRLPVSYVNLSGSKLDTSDRTANWDWMCSDTIGATLTVLVVNSVGLRTVPFEIMFLRRLGVLSLASNKLVSSTVLGRTVVRTIL